MVVQELLAMQNLESINPWSYFVWNPWSLWLAPIFSKVPLALSSCEKMRSTKLLCMTGLSALEYPFRSGATWHFRDFSMLKEPKKPWQTDVNEWWKFAEGSRFDLSLQCVQKQKTDEQAVKKLFRKRLDSTLCTMYNGQEDSQMLCSVAFVKAVCFSWVLLVSYRF